MRAVTLARIAEAQVVVGEMCVQAEEQRDVAHGVSEGAEHVSQEEIAELDWVQAGEEEAPVSSEEPLAGTWVEDGERIEQDYEGHPNEDDGIVDEHICRAVLGEVDPGEEAEEEEQEARELV